MTVYNDGPWAQEDLAIAPHRVGLGNLRTRLQILHGDRSELLLQPAEVGGVEVIVTDHHLVPAELPAGAIVVNPRQPGCDYPEKELAATGIAMKIALAVARRAGVRLSPESLLRAACLGTIADLVPLTGENRSIAAAGLAALAGARAPGLRALLFGDEGSEQGVSHA